MRCLCDFFFYFNAKIIEELIINTNDDLICRNIIKLLKKNKTKKHWVVSVMSFNTITRIEWHFKSVASMCSTN